MRRTIAATVAGAMIMLVAAPAYAQVDGGTSEGLLSASLNTTGTRSIATVTTPALTGSISGAPTSSYTVAVAEVARTGTNAWSVTAKLCGPNATNPLVSDCTNRPAVMVNAADATKTIPGSAVTIGSRAVSDLVSGSSGDISAPSGPADLSTARTLFSNANQETTKLYTDTYTATGTLTLTPPNGTVTGTYNGFVVVSLVQ